MKYVSINGNIATVAVEGSWSLIERVKVDDEIALAYSQGANTFIIDLNKTTMIDSAAIQGLVTLYRKAGKDNFGVINAHGEVFRALKAPKLTDWIKE